MIESAADCGLHGARAHDPARRDRGSAAVARTFTALGLAFVAGCERGPSTTVVLDNDYPATSTGALVVYRAYWQAVPFKGAVAPGSSSDTMDATPASANAAYVALAPGWDPDAAAPPASFVFLLSRKGFDVHLDGALRIPVDDATFIGNCGAGSFLSRAQADFITERIFNDAIFPNAFPPLAYDPATCTTTLVGDAGGP